MTDYKQTAITPADMERIQEATMAVCDILAPPGSVEPQSALLTMLIGVMLGTMANGSGETPEVCAKVSIEAYRALKRHMEAG